MSKILIVDDDGGIRLFLSEELAEEGYDVVTCDEASRLMECIEQGRPDLILMDIRLGPHNGLDLLQAIRNHYDALPVILCTAYPAFKHDMKSCAADYFVTKSYDLGELKSVVKEALEGIADFSLKRAQGAVQHP